MLGGIAIELPLLILLLLSFKIRVLFESNSILILAQRCISTFESVELLFRSFTIFIATNHPRLLFKKTTFWEELFAMFIDDS